MNRKCFKMLLFAAGLFCSAGLYSKDLVWNNKDFHIYKAKNHSVVTKMKDVPSGIEVIYRAQEKRPGVEMPFVLAAIVENGSVFSSKMAQYGAFAVDVENCNDRPLLFQVRIVSHNGPSERATENYRKVVPAHGKITMTVPYTTIAPFNKVELDSRLRLGPAGADCNVNLYQNRLSVDLATLSHSLYHEKEYRFKLTNFRFTGKPPVYHPLLAQPDKFFPLLDRFGQYRHADWPEKVKSEKELQERAAKEKAELAGIPAVSGRSRFGGWADGPTLHATGFFRVDRWNDRWTLVDPDGKLYFGLGIGGVTFRKNEYKKGRTHWFTTQGNHQVYNLKAKYGENYTEGAMQMAFLRLAKWGFNAVGGWCDIRVFQKHPVAYTPVLLDWSKKGLIPGRKFYDAFDPAFKKELDDNFQGKWKFSINDPWCIGYFIHNELQLHPAVNAERVAAAPASMPAKQEFRKYLEKKYPEISSLNKAWDSDYKNYEDFMQSRKVRFNIEKAFPDMDAFGKIMVEQYYKVCSEAVRRHAPNHLYFGSRIMPVAKADVDLAPLIEKYCDVVAINDYYCLYRNLRFPGMTKPIWLSEYSIRADGRGFWGVQQVKDQKERAELYRELLHDILANPNLVGVSWFSYYDQIQTGRDIEGEGYPWGFVDITDTPYREMGAMNREVGDNLYKIRFGSQTENK